MCKTETDRDKQAALDRELHGLAPNKQLSQHAGVRVTKRAWHMIPTSCLTPLSCIACAILVRLTLLPSHLTSYAVASYALACAPDLASYALALASYALVCEPVLALYALVSYAFPIRILLALLVCSVELPHVLRPRVLRPSSVSFSPSLLTLLVCAT